MNTVFDDDMMSIFESNDVLTLNIKSDKFNKSFKEFMKKFPGYASDVVRIGASALSQYKSAKSVTARFVAKGPIERKLYSDIVDTLVKSGKYKTITKKFKDGGVFFELVRT